MSKVKPDSLKGKDIPIFRSSVIVMIALGMGAITEMLKDIVIAYKYGAAAETDAFFLASGVLIILATVTISTANVSLVPVFSQMRRIGGEEATFRLGNKLSNILLAIAASLVVMGMIAAPVFMKLLGPGFSSEQFDLAVHMFRLLLPLVVFATLTSVNVALLNSQGRFWWSSSIGLVRNSAIITLIFLLSEQFYVWALPIALLIGYFIMFMSTTLPLIRDGYWLHPRIGWRDDRLKGALSLMWLPFLSLFLRQNGVTVERLLASFLAPGTISALNYASKIVLGLATILGSGIFTASLPNLSAWTLEGNTERVRQIIRRELQWLFILIVPITITLVLFAQQIVGILYEHGAFSAADTQLTAGALVLYALGMPFFSGVPLLQSVFYAGKDVNTPAIHMILMLAVNVVLDIVFMPLWGMQGLALAVSVTGFVSFSRLLWMANRRIKLLVDKNAIVSVTRILIAGMFFAGSVTLMHTFWGSNDSSLLQQVIGLLIVLGVGGSIYAVTTIFLVRPAISGRRLLGKKMGASTVSHYE